MSINRQEGIQYWSDAAQGLDALDNYLDEIDELSGLPNGIYDAFQLLWDYVYEVGRYSNCKQFMNTLDKTK